MEKSYAIDKNGNTYICNAKVFYERTITVIMHLMFFDDFKPFLFHSIDMIDPPSVTSNTKQILN